MSATEATESPAKSGRTVALWLAFLFVIAVGIGLAWIGAGSLRPVVTESGLQFRTIKAGSGEPAGPADAAVLDYILTADDGTIIDSSSNHGGAQPFAMDSVFPGFAEAMTRMKEGGQYRFTMPQKLAFGAGPPPPNFPKDSALTFDVRVQKIVRGGAAMMHQIQAQQAQQAQEAPQQ